MGVSLLAARTAATRYPFSNLHADSTSLFSYHRNTGRTAGFSTRCARYRPRRMPSSLSTSKYNMIADTSAAARAVTVLSNRQTNVCAKKASPQVNCSAAEQRHAEPPEGFQAERCPPVQDGKVDRSGARSGQKHGKQVAVNAERWPCAPAVQQRKLAQLRRDGGCHVPPLQAERIEQAAVAIW